MQKQIFCFFAIIVFGCIVQIAAADDTIAYLDRDGKQQLLNVVSCPAGEHVLVKDFKVTGTLSMPAFLVAKQELSAEHYSVLVDLSKGGAPIQCCRRSKCS